MPTIIFDTDYKVPYTDESYSAGQSVTKNRASCDHFVNRGVAHYATTAELAGEKKADVKPAVKPDKKKSGPSSQAAPVSREPIATSSSDVESQPLASTTPTK